MHNITSPATDDSAIEREIQAKGKTAARITPQSLQDNIIAVNYFTAANGVKGEACANCNGETKLKDVISDDGTDADKTLGLLTFCVLVLRNGFTVTGESACASPENFDAEIGRKIAYENAKQKVWPLMGYELKCRLAKD